MNFKEQLNVLNRNIENREMENRKMYNPISSFMKLTNMKRIDFPKVHNLTGGTHPSVKFFPDGFSGFKYWMAYTPYPDKNYENPTIVCSNNGYDWQTPSGLINPIDNKPSNGYNSDTELVWNGNILYCYWRTYYYEKDENVLYRMESNDGIVWENKTACTLDVYHDPLSPSIVVDINGNYKMWIGAYDGQPMRFYESNNGVDFEYKEDCESNYDDFGSHWHPSVWVEGNKYRCLSSFTTKFLQPDRPSSTIRKTILLYGTSSDGINWIFDNLPFVSPHVEGEKNIRIYRSCCVFNGNAHMIYISGRGSDWEQINVFEGRLLDY